MARATHGVHSGTYYFEVEVLQPEDRAADAQTSSSHSPGSLSTAHVRVGWSTRDGELQSSVGYDNCSYGLRDDTG